MSDSESKKSDKPHPHNTSSGWNERYLSNRGLAVPGTFTHSENGNRQFYKVKFRAIDRCLKLINEDLSGKTIIDVAGGSGQFVDFFLRKEVGAVMVTDFSEMALREVSQRYKDVKNVSTTLFDMKDADRTWHDQYDFAFVMEAVFLLVSDNDFARAIRNLSTALKKWRLSNHIRYLSGADVPTKRLCRPSLKIQV